MLEYMVNIVTKWCNRSTAEEDNEVTVAAPRGNTVGEGGVEPPLLYEPGYTTTLCSWKKNPI
jgi:hypothetical protein